MRRGYIGVSREYVGFRVYIGSPKIRGTLLGILIIRIIAFWGLYWGHLFNGSYHLEGQGNE